MILPPLRTIMLCTAYPARSTTEATPKAIMLAVSEDVEIGRGLLPLIATKVSVTRATIATMPVSAAKRHMGSLARSMKVTADAGSTMAARLGPSRS